MLNNIYHPRYAWNLHIYCCWLCFIRTLQLYSLCRTINCSIIAQPECQVSIIRSGSWESNCPFRHARWGKIKGMVSIPLCVTLLAMTNFFLFFFPSCFYHACEKNTFFLILLLLLDIHFYNWKVLLKLGMERRHSKPRGSWSINVWGLYCQFIELIYPTPLDSSKWFSSL